MKVVIVRTIECEEEAKEVMEYMFYQELFEKGSVKYHDFDEGIIISENEKVEFSLK